MEPLIVNSDPSLQEAIGLMREDYTRHRFLRVKWTTGQKRSALQNDQIYVWYDQIARELREDDKTGWRRFCKLHFGVPILRDGDADFRAFYDLAVKWLQYPDKLKAMDHIDITSRMNKTQLSKYHEAMQDHFKPLGVALKYQEKKEQAA